MGEYAQNYPTRGGFLAISLVILITQLVYIIPPVSRIRQAVASYFYSPSSLRAILGPPVMLQAYQNKIWKSAP